MTKTSRPNFTQSFAPVALPEGPLSGLRVGIKDLFDVAGYVTKAGSRTRAELPPAGVAGSALDMFTVDITVVWRICRRTAGR